MKESYERIDQELRSAERKKQTLHELFKKGKISSSTYEYVSKTINDTIEKIKVLHIEHKERMAKKAHELENQVRSSENLFSQLNSSCASSDEEKKINKYETQLSAFTSGLDAIKEEATYVKGNQFNSVEPMAVPPNLNGNQKIEKPIKVQTLITPLLTEKKIIEMEKKPNLETHKRPVATQPKVQKPTEKTSTKKRTNKRKTKLKMKTKRKAKKRLKKPRKKKSVAEIPHRRRTSRGHCRNPWNGECNNMDIEVSIYYKKELLPICRSCWNDIAEKDITW